MRDTTNSVPTPCSLFTRMEPFIISTMFFVIAIPSPVPCILLMVELRSRSKGSKMRLTNSSLMPMPVSLMVKSKFAYPVGAMGVSRIRMVTRPPGPVYLMELPRRFSSTWFSRSLSQ